MSLDENKYPWIKHIKPMIRLMIREELGYEQNMEAIPKLIKEEIDRETPARHNHLWSKQERELLLQRVHLYPLPNLALAHERTLGAIIMQLKREWESGNI